MNNTLDNLKFSESFNLKGKVKIITYKAGTKEILRETPFYENTVMFGTNTGKDLKRLGGNNTYSMNILYLDIGTSSTTPATSDTQLGAAVARAGSPAITQVGNVLSFQFFFADANLANGTYNEVGTFVDGSGSINTGQIFNHALFGSAYVKTAGEDTTIQVDFTLT
jgi:hypothetical protein